MRFLIGMLVIVVLAMTCAGCGRGNKQVKTATGGSSVSTDNGSTAVPTDTTASTTTQTSPAKSDRDGDSDNNDDDYDYGHAANAIEGLSITQVVTRYYKAAASEGGASGCALIYSLYAEEIPEVYGEESGPPSLRGNTCAVVMSKLFKQEHQRLTTDFATMKILAIRIRRLRGLVIMSFKSMPQRDIAIHREGDKWKIDELLDTNLG
jgi:hypothetical protein